MKKRLSIIALLLLFALMLASCDSLLGVLPAPLTANQVVRRMNTRLNGLQSYRIDVTGNIVAYADYKKITGTLTGVAIEDIGDGKDDYYTYIEMTNKSSVGSSGDSITVKTTEAYYDGYAYSYYSEGDTWRRLCSPMTKREYQNYVADDSLLELNPEDCKNKELEKNDDGYVVKYSEYSKAAIEDFAQKVGLTEDMFGEEPVDLAVTIETDKDYYPKSFSMTIVFDDSDSYYQPEFTMTMTYSKFDEAERITRTLSPDNYHEIDSLSLLKEVDEMIEDRINAKKGSFTAKSEAYAHFMTQSNKQTVTNQVSFERKGKDLTFEVEQKTDDQTTIITYADGKKREERDGIVTPESMSNDEAEQMLLALANDPLMGYNPNYVTDIKKTDEGFEITMDVSSSSALGQIITSSGAKFSSGRHTIEIKVDNGKITSIEHAYSASGSVSLGYGKTASLNYTGSSDVTFE